MKKTDKANLIFYAKATFLILTNKTEIKNFLDY